MQSSFRILLEGDGVLMAMASELLEPQLADLKKYAVFSKSKLTDESAALGRRLLIMAMPRSATSALNCLRKPTRVVRSDGLIAIRVSPDRAELWVSADQAGAIKGKLSALLAEGDLNQWLLGQIRAGIGQVMPGTRELFIPQMLNLQAVGGVSFKKVATPPARKSSRGCNTWANSSAASPRLQLDASRRPEPGTQLFSQSHGSSIGEVVLAAHGEQQIELLAVLQAEAAEAGDLHVGAVDGPATCSICLINWTATAKSSVNRSTFLRHQENRNE